MSSRSFTRKTTVSHAPRAECRVRVQCSASSTPPLASACPLCFVSIALYADATRELAQCMDDWHRNSHAINVQRLLTTLQSIFPSVKQLLHEDHRAHAPSSSAVGLPDLAAHFQADVDQALEEFQERMAELQRQKAELEHEIRQPQPDDPTTHSRTNSRHTTEEHDRNQLKSSSGRNTNRALQHEPPPFQF
jgi:hypothetical protein